ncbi:MAG TPA: ABC transporter ATP-binding protein [Phycisphaerales bacterium]|nr:ABC transporter ATP-binding protein [Phycisphaerales bacterium]
MIHIEKLRKTYGPLVALNDLSLSIGPGEVFGFIGPNGAGKSTTMKILAGLVRADSGKAHVCGLDAATQIDLVKHKIGYMPDFLGVYDDLTVDEYLQFFAAAFEIGRKRRRAVIDSVLQLTDLTGKRHAMVDSLSRGMQQRLGVARVLLHEPSVLLLDEPASGLDPRARIELRELLLELKRMGKCIMISSHILTELAEMSSSIGIIERGTLLYAGSIDDAFRAAGVGERVAVTFEPGPLDASTAALHVQGDPRLLGVDVEGDTLVATFDPAHRSHHFLIEKLVAAGARIAAFTPRPVRLEEVFLRITKGALQ